MVAPLGKSIAFLADDPPIREDVHGWGLSRVNGRFIEALRDHLSVIACGSSGLYSLDDLPQDQRSITTMWGAQTRARRLGKRIFKSAYDDEADFTRSLPTIARRIRDSRTDVVFSPCGIDPKALRHLVAVKDACRIPVAAYLVDDFLDGATLSGNREAHGLAVSRVPDWLRRIDKLFVISQGLQERVWDLYSLESTVLPLPYVTPDAAATTAVKDQIIFVGNLSHFYIDGLRDLADALDDLRRDGIAMKLRLTMPSAEMARDALGARDSIECRQCPGPDALRDEIASSVAAFAPYSFDDRYSVMVATSFPSKMLDYLSAARSVVSYGPAYSTSARYFSHHGLESSITDRDPQRLKASILDSRQASHGHGADYRRVLQSQHSPARIADQIVASLF